MPLALRTALLSCKGTSRCPFCSADVGSSFVYLASMASTTLGCVLPLIVTCFVLPWCALGQTMSLQMPGSFPGWPLLRTAS